jgi:hypothetical protein
VTLEPEAVAVRREQLLDSSPTRALADHAGSESTVILLSATHIANRIHHFAVPQRKRFGQTCFEDRTDLERKPQGMIGATATDVSIPASERMRRVSKRLLGELAKGSIARA